MCGLAGGTKVAVAGLLAAVTTLRRHDTRRDMGILGLDTVDRAWMHSPQAGSARYRPWAPDLAAASDWLGVAALARMACASITNATRRTSLVPTLVHVALVVLGPTTTTETLLTRTSRQPACGPVTG